MYRCQDCGKVFYQCECKTISPYITEAVRRSKLPISVQYDLDSQQFCVRSDMGEMHLQSPGLAIDRYVSWCSRLLWEPNHEPL